MTITLELAPELQAELARQAATRGVKVDVYAASLLEDAYIGPLHVTSLRHFRLPLRSSRPSSGSRALERPINSRPVA